MTRRPTTPTSRRPVLAPTDRAARAALARGLGVALVLVPHAYSRNRFFALFEDAELGRVRRRAARVRGLIRQLAGEGTQRAEVVGETVLADGQVLIKLRIDSQNAERTTALSELEAATLRYALHRAGRGGLAGEDRALVESALAELGELR